MGEAGLGPSFVWLIPLFFLLHFLAPKDTIAFLSLQRGNMSIFLAMDMDMKRFYLLFKITNKIVGGSQQGQKNKIPVRRGKLT